MLNHKSIDDAAPDVWKQMMKHPSPTDYYDELNISDRRIIDKWKENRSSNLHDRLVKEIEEKISELGKDSPPSTSFIRLLVQTPEDHLSNYVTHTHKAILTIWSPNEEQLDEIKENVTIRVKHADVKPVRFNGLLQLSGGSCCVLKDNESNERSETRTRFSSFFQLFVNVSKQMVDRTTHASPLRENVVGMVLNIEYFVSGWSMLLSDETGKLLRLKGNDPAALEVAHLEDLTAEPLTNLREDAITIAAFKNIIITGIDMKRSCLLARYSSESSFVAPPSLRELALRRWYDSPRGQRRLLQAMCLHRLCPCHSSTVVVGYITGMHLVPSKELILEIDACGHSRTLKLPLSLILSLSQSKEEAIFFAEREENQIEQFRKLSQILRSRKSLYAFGTCTTISDCGVAMQVTSIHKSSTLALATLYSTFV